MYGTVTRASSWAYFGFAACLGNGNMPNQPWPLWFFYLLSQNKHKSQRNLFPLMGYKVRTRFSSAASPPDEHPSSHMAHSDGRVWCAVVCNIFILTRRQIRHLEYSSINLRQGISIIGTNWICIGSRKRAINICGNAFLGNLCVMVWGKIREEFEFSLSSNWLFSYYIPT